MPDDLNQQKPRTEGSESPTALWRLTCLSNSDILFQEKQISKQTNKALEADDECWVTQSADMPTCWTVEWGESHPVVLGSDYINASRSIIDRTGPLILEP